MKYSALNYALFLLGKCDRSVGEIKAKMTEKNFSSTEIAETIEMLKAKNFLNDERFARNFIANQINLKPQGQFVLKSKLKRKFIDEKVIDMIMVETSDNEKTLAKKAIEKWRKNKYQAANIKYQGDKNKIKNLLIRHLISRGFNYDVIKEVLN